MNKPKISIGGVRDVEISFTVSKELGEAVINYIFDYSKPQVHTIKCCQNAEFNGIKCLENSDSFGFYKSEHDIRPSSCLWINKDDAIRLYHTFEKHFEEKED